MKTNILILTSCVVLFSACKDDKDDSSSNESDADTDADADTDTDTDTDADPFVFLTDDPGTYTRVDRMGMPAVATAVISSKDAYNAADPTDDAAGDFVGEITASVKFLHGALDDDLTGLGLTPCDVSDCVAQAAPFVVPDEIAIDTTGTAGFPNGRMLTDQVIDVTLALILLDLGTHSVTTFASIPVNPSANDAAFSATFPYLATAH